MKYLMLICLLTTSFAHARSKDALTFSDAYIRFVPAERGVSAAFVKIRNTSKEDKEIVKIESDRFEDIELHTHAIFDGVMKMRKVESMLVKAGSERVLKSKSDHIMFFGFKKPLVVGEKIILKMIFKDKKSQNASFEVRR